MNNKKHLLRNKRVLNKYSLGTESLNTLKQSFNLNNIGSTIGALTGAATTIGSGLSNMNIDSGNTEAEINEASNFNSSASDLDSLMQEWSNYDPLEHVNWKDVRGGSDSQRLMSTLSGLSAGASAGATIGGPIGSIVGGAVGLGSNLIGWLTGNKKAKKKAQELNDKIDIVNNRNWATLANKANTLDAQTDYNLLANYSANGGPINMLYTGVMSPFGNRFDEGGSIHIKPENRGKFTALKKRTGKSATWFKEHGTPAQKKMAVFALNARKWKHENGGPLTHGGVFDNEVTIINNGNTHESNPYEGVQLGVDNQGIPNLVEEGEVIFNNYVFSNRLKVPKEVKNKYKLRGSKNLTFAEAAKYAQKESEERPNDPISKRGLESIMGKLAIEQEAIREIEDNKNKKSNKYAEGGYFDFDIPLAGDETLTPITPRRVTIQDIDPSNSLGLFSEPYLEDRSTVTKTNTNGIKKPSVASLLRYAPVIGSGISFITSLLEKPDYSNADLINRSVRNLNNVEFNPIGNYLTYKPLDRDYYINKLNAQSGATRRAIIDQSGGNRANAMANILAADYNAQGRIGDLARQAEEYNLAQRERVEGFNRQTNMYNSEGAMKASIANKANDELRLKAALANSQMRDEIDNRLSSVRSANLTNLFDSLGEIGREEFAKDMIKNNESILYDWMGNYKGKKNSKGGLLTVKKRRK